LIPLSPMGRPNGGGGSPQSHQLTYRFDHSSMRAEDQQEIMYDQQDGGGKPDLIARTPLRKELQQQRQQRLALPMHSISVSPAPIDYDGSYHPGQYTEKSDYQSSQQLAIPNHISVTKVDSPCHTPALLEAPRWNVPLSPCGAPNKAGGFKGHTRSASGALSVYISTPRSVSGAAELNSPPIVNGGIQGSFLQLPGDSIPLSPCVHRGGGGGGHRSSFGGTNGELRIALPASYDDQSSHANTRLSPAPVQMLRVPAMHVPLSPCRSPTRPATFSSVHIAPSTPTAQQYGAPTGASDDSSVGLWCRVEPASPRPGTPTGARSSRASLNASTVRF